MNKIELIKEMKERFNGCVLMDGRDKGDFDELVGVVVSINAYKKLTGDKGDYYCVTFAGFEDKYYLSGGAITELLDTWGDEALGVEFEICAKTKTKSGNTYRPITIK